MPFPKGGSHTPESRAKMSAAHRGKKHTEATRAKMSEARRGQPKSAETKARMAAAKVGPLNPQWRGEAVGIGSLHRRIERLRGKASDHACVEGCGRQARDWSFKEPTGHSTDPADYEPRCRSCHVKRDRGIT